MSSTARTEKIENLKKLQAEYTTLQIEAQIHERSIKIWTLVHKTKGDAGSTLQEVALNIEATAGMFEDCCEKMLDLNQEMYTLGEELRE